MPTFILIHSPLVGPLTWTLVAGELLRRGYPALTPALPDSRQISPPYWQAHSESVAKAARAIPSDESIVLMSHSGAGALLPAVRAALHRPVAAYVFVDALLPQPNASRLDLFGIPEQVTAFRQAAVAGLLPVWSADDLRDAIPDSDVRTRFAAELRPLPLAVYEEPVPVFGGCPMRPPCICCSIAPPMPPTGSAPNTSAGPASNCRAVTSICSTTRSPSLMQF